LQAFLVSVFQPLDLIMVRSLPSKQYEDVRPAWWKQLSAAAGFTIETVLTDGEGVIATMETELNDRGIEASPTGAGQHVPGVENEIWQIEEWTRVVIDD